jgi:hypothetical protein
LFLLLLFLHQWAMPHYKLLGRVVAVCASITRYSQLRMRLLPVNAITSISIAVITAYKLSTVCCSLTSTNASTTGYEQRHCNNYEQTDVSPCQGHQ